jgi:two-component system chemotaxis sensor kinase CheA
MDTSEYIGMFLAESREHLQTLNLAIIRIEETPSDSETIDEIFRIAHSLKGMSGTMGFARMAALTHTMEDVFETLRGRTGGLERRVIDILLECLDVLEGAVEAIETNGDENFDPTTLIARLSELSRRHGGPYRRRRPARCGRRVHGRRPPPAHRGRPRRRRDDARGAGVHGAHGRRRPR